MSKGCEVEVERDMAMHRNIENRVTSGGAMAALKADRSVNYCS
jgi:hypothetical protein